MGHASLRDIVTEQLPILTCPSDPSAMPNNNQFYWRHLDLNVAVTSYKGVIGDNELAPVDNPFEPRFNELFTASNGYGSSPDCHNNIFGCNGLFGRMAYFDPVELKQVSDGLSNTFMVGESVSSQDYHGAAFFADGDWAVCSLPINLFLNEGEEPDLIIDKWYELRGFKSLHPGGAQFAFADGSVHFINEDIDHMAFRAYATRDGGEVATTE